MTLESYLTGNTPYYDPLVVIYEHKMFIRLATAQFAASNGVDITFLYSMLFKHTNCILQGMFHKTFLFVIYGHFAGKYRIFAIYEQIYSQNLAITTNP